MCAFVVSGLVFFIPSQKIGLGKCLQNDLFCVEWDVKPQLSQAVVIRGACWWRCDADRVVHGSCTKQDFAVCSTLHLPTLSFSSTTCNTCRGASPGRSSHQRMWVVTAKSNCVLQRHLLGIRNESVLVQLDWPFPMLKYRYIFQI